jgi:hypothetical protein
MSTLPKQKEMLTVLAQDPVRSAWQTETAVGLAAPLGPGLSL